MAVDMFLKLDGIKGESLDAKHKGEIEVLSFSWGMSQVGSSGAGGGSGKVSVHDISITKVTDSSTPQLMKSCATGQHIPTGLITVRKAGEKPLEYLKIKLTDILISSVQMGGARSGTPSESFTLNFAKMDVFALPLTSVGVASTVEIVNDEAGVFQAPPT